MNIGAAMVGISLAAMAASYVIRPLRVGQPATVDDAIEAWVAAARGGRPGTDRRCPKCGRSTGRGDRFCAACGTPVAPEE
ncbi:MAG: zinc-ribbon domain-containing protein [Anaerolineae bacterium]